MNDQFWRNAPKTYCDNANMATMSGLGDVVLLALMSGQNAQVFSFTPEHMKRLIQMMTHNLKKFEDARGPIKVDEWTSEVKSPLQIKDFKNGDDGQAGK